MLRMAAQDGEETQNTTVRKLIPALLETNYFKVLCGRT
jgi:hypothetical protein